MAQLGGKATRTVLTSLELLSDDGEHVLMLDSVDGFGGGGVTFKTRRPWESTWGQHPTFTVNSRDADLVAKLVANQDAKYVERQLADIVTSDFSGKDPNPPEDEQAKADYEARCTELDIERARAANIQQEFILDHSRDRHISDVTGCPSCEIRIRPGYGDGSFVGGEDEHLEAAFEDSISGDDA